MDALWGYSMKGDDNPLLAPHLLTPQSQQGSFLLCPLHPAGPFLPPHICPHSQTLVLLRLTLTCPPHS